MALNCQCVKWFYLLKIKYGVDFSNVATLGRQGFDNRSLISKLKAKRELGNIFHVKDLLQADGYSENVWKALGCKKDCLDTFDYSDYEGANCLHDMNVPIPEKYKDKYSVVVDSGTLEHVFNYPLALRNAMSMVKVGGELILITPGNQYLDHGFYQFSPVLFYSILNKKNGYEIQEFMFADLEKSYKKNLSRVDIYTEKERKTKHRVMLFVAAKRVGNIPECLVVQQPRFENTWKSVNENDDNKVLFPRVRKFMLSHSNCGRIYFRLTNFIRNKKKSIQIQTYDLDKEIKSIMRTKKK